MASVDCSYARMFLVFTLHWAVFSTVMTHATDQYRLLLQFVTKFLWHVAWIDTDQRIILLVSQARPNQPQRGSLSVSRTGILKSDPRWGWLGLATETTTLRHIWHTKV